MKPTGYAAHDDDLRGMAAPAPTETAVHELAALVLEMARPIRPAMREQAIRLLGPAVGGGQPLRMKPTGYAAHDDDLRGMAAPAPTATAKANHSIFEAIQVPRRSSSC